MKVLHIIFSILTSITVFGQINTAKDYGFKHIEFNYKAEKIDILVKSKKGEENVNKPIMLFCQGSMPQPLIKIENGKDYNVFPFNPDIFISKYHLVIISKPGIPLISDVKNLGNNFNFVNSEGQFPKSFTDKNYLDYYVFRNIEIIKFLQKQNWVSKSQVVVAGHSEGSTIAAKMASKSKAITHLIYSGGNPMGRIMSMIQQSRSMELDSDSTLYGEQEITYWAEVVKNKNSLDASNGDAHKCTFDFSIPPINYLDKLKIQVLISYGTKDWSAPFNDYLRVEIMRKNKMNFKFNPYINTEHNYFPVDSMFKPDFEIYNWDKVASDWLKWLNQN